MFKTLTAMWPILLLTMAHGAVDSFGGLLAVLAPGVAKMLDVPIGKIVMLIGISGLLNNLSQPLIGLVMERRNLRWVLWLTVVVSALPIFMGFVPNFWWLCVIIILGAFGTGIYHPEGILSAQDVSGHRAYLGVPLFMAGGAAIYACLIPLSIWLTEQHGFKSLAFLGIPGAIIALLLILLYRERARAHPSVILRPRSRRVTKVHADNLSYWPLLAMAVCFCIASGLFMAILTSHYELRFGESARHAAGYVLVVMGLLGSAASFGWSWLSKKYSYYPMTLISQLIAAPLFLLMASPPTPNAGILISIPLALVTPAALHPVGIMLARNAAGLTQSIRTGLIMGGAYGAASIAIMIAGLLLDKNLPSPHLIQFCALCSLASALIALWQILAKRRQGKNAAAA